MSERSKRSPGLSEANPGAPCRQNPDFASLNPGYLLVARSGRSARRAVATFAAPRLFRFPFGVC